ncbi:MAG: peptidase S8, partial [Ignavibacteriales bacterium CG_4_9_14_3_um_filter_30_11]
QNNPNPFNPTTQINYAIKQEGLVTINIYDVLGRVITTLVNENKTAGFYTVNFDASKFSSGVYFYTIKSNDFFDRKKMIVMK